MAGSSGAFVPDHQHDIFVSYAWGDAQRTGKSLMKDWTAGFARQLMGQFALSPDIGKKVKIFIDSSDSEGGGIAGMGGLNKQLEEGVGRSAFLLVVMSRQYLDSHYCGKEREVWNGLQANAAVPALERIAVVRAWPTGEAPWPPELCDAKGAKLVGYQFFDKAKDADMARPYGFELLPADPSGPEFSQEITRLTGELGRAMRRYKEEKERERNEAAKRQQQADGELNALYLHGRETQGAPWQESRSVLDRAGFTVLPTKPDPLSKDPLEIQNIRANRVNAMSGCDACLLVAGKDGMALEADMVTVGRNDRNSARALSGAQLPCAVIDRSGNTVKTEERLGVAKKLNIGWIDASPPSWPDDLRSWLAGNPP